MPFATDGRWSGTSVTPGDSLATDDALGVFVVHAVLMKNGRVLVFSGRVENSNYLAESWVWDPSQPIGAAVKQAFPGGEDLFCCHMAVLDDGRVITVGGAQAAPDHGGGIRAICVFDPDSPGWTRIGQMNEARWYPTLVTLPDGRLVVFSGRRQRGAPPLIAPTAELLAPPFSGPGYTPQTLAGGDKTFPTYPGLHLVRGGRIIHTGTTWRYEDTVTNPIGTFSFRVTGPGTASWTDEGVSPNVDPREEGMSVLLPPAQDGKILLLGGAKANRDSLGNFTGFAAGSEPRAAEILDTTVSPPVWTRIADMNQPRINGNAVLLPDGKVFVHGGHNRYKFDSTSVPSNQAEIYNPVPDVWTAAATMNSTRMYHSAAILLPDGRVLCAGGYDPNAGGDGNLKTFEFFEPPYFFNADDTLAARPVISSLQMPEGPAGQLAYGGVFTINTPDAASISKVALTRPNSMTHHTDSEQRYVALDFAAGPGANQLTVAVVNDPSVAPPGFYMLWIVDSNNRPCQQAVFVKLSQQRCFTIVDKSTYSRDEVAPAGGPTSFDESIYIVMDGFLPAELGITTATPVNPPPPGLSPSLQFRRSDGAVVAEIDAIAQQLLYELPALPAGVRQRFTFKYTVRIDGQAPFLMADGTTPIESQTLTLLCTLGSFSCQGSIRLVNQPNPFMLDGDVPWLSVDVRVFQISEGASRFGQTMGNSGAAAVNFIQGVLTRWNDPALAVGVSEFGGVLTDPDASRLELARSRGGLRVFNFAVAQVRYRGRTLPATDVRVFFRLFTTAATGMDFRAATTYRTMTNTSGEPIAVLGLVGGQIGTIPCFATARVDTSLQSMTAQRDLPNTRTIAPSVSPGGTMAYFGAFLDINQTELRFPNSPGGFGPYASGLQSVQNLIRGRHQCLVAEVFFNPNPAVPLVNEGDTPGSSDKLSQRNLAIVESDNPGSADSHTVQHTFEVKPSMDPALWTPGMPAAMHGGPVPDTHIATPDTHTHGGVGVAQPGNLRISPEADELMIRWRSLPRNSQAYLYLPDVGADEILRLAAMRIGPSALARVDNGTVECKVGDVTYVPLPGRRVANIPGLITIRLPDGIRKGQIFKVEVQQVSGLDHRVIGSFELLVQVRAAEPVIANLRNDLAVFLHIFESIPPPDPWRPVIERYLAGMKRQLRGLGSDPGVVQPSPDGFVPDDREAEKERKRRIILWIVLLLLLLVAATCLKGHSLLVASLLLIAWVVLVLVILRRLP